MLTFQAEEIEAARLKPGEDEELRLERDRLANAESLAANAQEALQLLDEGTPETPAVTDQLGQAVAALASLARVDTAKTELAAPRGIPARKSSPIFPTNCAITSKPSNTTPSGWKMPRNAST